MNDRRWFELLVNGFTVINLAQDFVGDKLKRAQASANVLADQINYFEKDPSKGGPQDAEGLWREIAPCSDAAIREYINGPIKYYGDQILSGGLDEVTNFQLAMCRPKHTPLSGRRGHIDGGTRKSGNTGPLLNCFNLLFALPLTAERGGGSGGFRVMSGSHLDFGREFANVARSGKPDINWVDEKQQLIENGPLKHVQSKAWSIIDCVTPGTIIIAHMFLFHGTDWNRTNARRDMAFVRATAKNQAGNMNAFSEALMRDMWTGIEIPKPHQSYLKNLTTS